MNRLRRNSLVALIVFVVLVAVSPLSPLYWMDAHAYYEPQKQDAMRFCEALVPQIEAANKRDGNYPTVIDPQWIAGKRIPKLIRVQDFYLSHSSGYLLRFRNPGDFFDDIWGFHSHDGTGSWANYDGY